MTTKIYTHEEVSLHNNEMDLWIIINNGVYDLTKFLKEHPGGEEVLIKLAGLDGTICFDEIGHTREAVQLRETYKIGNIDPNSLPVNNNDDFKSKNDDNDDDWQYEEQKEDKKTYLLPIIVGSGAIIYFFILYSWIL